MKKIFTLSLFILCFQIPAQSIYTNIQISNTNGPNEPSICINPKNTNQLVGGANLNSYYWSSDAGMNWTRGTLTSTYSVWGDPCVIVDTVGNFYYFHLTNPSGGYFIDRIVCQKSTDAGVTYQNGSFMGYIPPKQQDKAWGCVDFTHGARGNWIYCTWTQFDVYGSSNTNDSSHILFSRSSDGGTTWTAALRIDKRGGNCIDEDNTVEGAVPCIGPNGEVYVSWSGSSAVGQFKLFFDKTTDGGTTWLANDIVAGDQPGGWDLGPNNTIGVTGIYRANGLPITCCDISNSPYRGHIYINYLDSVGSHDRDVKVIKSTDGGTTWSSPVRINNDAAGKEQFFTWMTIDRANGHLYCVFYDRRNYTDNNTDVFIARSTNGGVTWTNERISASPFLPTTGTFFGDYNNITVYNGKVRPIWIRLVSGALSCWTAIIDFPVGVNTNTNEIPKEFVLYQNYPNPFNPMTSIKFDIPENVNLTLKVYDSLGEEVAVLTNGNYNAGSYEIKWDASEISSGVYFCTLNIESGLTITKKIILTK